MDKIDGYLELDKYCDCKPPIRAIAFRRNFMRIINILSRKFVYKGLPETIPETEIEFRLLLSGKCIITEYKKSLMAIWGNVYGYNEFSHPDKFTALQAGMKNSVTGTLDYSGIVIYNSTTDKFFPNSISEKYLEIQCTANLLTDIDLSLNASLINGRSTNAVVAKDTTSHDALTSYYHSLINGELYVPFIETGILPFVEDLHKNFQRDVTSPTELHELRERVLKAFFAHNGIQTVLEKRERMITDEVNANNDFLEAGVRDELDSRREGLKKMNEAFDLNVTVEVNNYVSNDMAEKSEQSNDKQL